jgi:hypothetical protein
VILSAIGSSLGMVGIVLQTNAYYAFKSAQLFEHLFRVTRTLLRKGRAAARRQIDVTVTLAALKGEDRVKSLIGLYCVLFGFFLQLIGSLILILAIFIHREGVAIR